MLSIKLVYSSPRCGAASAATCREAASARNTSSTLGRSGNSGSRRSVPTPRPQGPRVSSRRRARDLGRYQEKELIGDFHMKGQEWQPKGKPDPVRTHDFIDR